MGFFLFDILFGWMKPKSKPEAAAQNFQDVAPKLRVEIDKLKKAGKHKEAERAEEELARFELNSHKKVHEDHNKAA